jgi:hypothetical protein
MSKHHDKKTSIYFTTTPIYSINLGNKNNPSDCDPADVAQWVNSIGFIPNPTDTSSNLALPSYGVWQENNQGVYSTKNQLNLSEDPLNNPNLNALEDLDFNGATFIYLTANSSNVIVGSNDINDNLSVYLNIAAPNMTQDFFKVMKLTNLETKESRYYSSKHASYGGSNTSFQNRYGSNIANIDRQGAFFGWSKEEDFFKVGDKMKLTFYY